MPFSEYDTVFFGIGVERTEISGATSLPNSYFLYREQFGDTSNSVPLTDRLDARQPRQRAGADRRPLPARQPRLGARSATRSTCAPTCRYQQYLPLITRSSPSASTPRSATARASAGQPYPIFKNFYGGGLGTVRGFDQGSLGPVDVTGAFIGGNRRLNVNSELYLPVPGAGNDRTLRLFGYVDAGNVWGENEKLTLRQPARLGRRRA